MPRHNDFEAIYQNFIKQYGAEQGKAYYYAWLKKNDLDDTKPYNVEEQYFNKHGISESFKWVEKATNVFMNDTKAKYYRVRALTANISMNKNDYRDVEKLMMAAKGLGWRPININHDHAHWLPFPEARVHYAKFEDNAVEAIIRIPNTLPDIQDKLDKGLILHPSIEGFPLEGYGTETSEGFDPDEYTFTALALLEKGVQLPGDPLTTIEPLTESYMTPISDKMGKSFIESLKPRDQLGQAFEKLEKENLPKQMKKIMKELKVQKKILKKIKSGLEIQLPEGAKYKGFDAKTGSLEYTYPDGTEEKVQLPESALETEVIEEELKPKPAKLTRILVEPSYFRRDDIFNLSVDVKLTNGRTMRESYTVTPNNAFFNFIATFVYPYFKHIQEEENAKDLQ